MFFEQLVFLDPNLLSFVLCSFEQYMNNWLPYPKAQYLSPSGRERKRRKRRNGRQRNIGAELGLMKTTRGLGHLDRFSPRNLRKLGVAVLLC